MPYLNVAPPRISERVQDGRSRYDVRWHPCSCSYRSRNWTIGRIGTSSMECFYNSPQLEPEPATWVAWRPFWVNRRVEEDYVPIHPSKTALLTPSTCVHTHTSKRGSIMYHVTLILKPAVSIPVHQISQRPREKGHT